MTYMNTEPAARNSRMAHLNAKKEHLQRWTDEAVRLREQGYTIHEIAQELQVSYGTAHKRLKAAGALEYTITGRAKQAKSARERAGLPRGSSSVPEDDENEPL